MRNDNKSLIKAAKLLKANCFENPDCEECIFYDGFCRINGEPYTYELDGINSKKGVTV